MTAVPRVAEVMSRFPKVSETFVLTEILELERRGIAVEVFPLTRTAHGPVHREAERLVERAHRTSPLAPALWAAQGAQLRRRPGAYVAAWAGALAGNAASPKFLSRALAIVPEAALIAERCRRLGVGHVHAHFASHPALAAWAVHRLTGLPFSFTVHAHDLYVDRSMLAEKLRAARFVVAISDFNRRMIGDLYGPDALAKTHVVRCGIDPALFRPAAPLPDRRGTLRIVCVASLEEYKGHRYLLEACARLRSLGRRFRCTLVGDGELRAELERLAARLGVADRVRFAGARPRHEVAALMSGADVVVLPSVVTPSGKMEGLPVVLMEALAMALPVVATRISGIPELVEHGVTGLLVPQRDEAAIAGALQILGADPALRSRLGAAGRERTLERHDQRRNVGRLAELLSESLASGPARTGATPGAPCPSPPPPPRPARWGRRARGTAPAPRASTPASTAPGRP